MIVKKTKRSVSRVGKHRKKHAPNILAIKFNKRVVTLLVLGVLGASLLLFAATSYERHDIRQRAAATIHEITISNSSVNITNLTIPVGDTVTWVNQDNIEHDVVGFGHEWESPILAPGQSYSHTFTTPGVRTYHCSLHSATMKDYHITVLPAPTEITPTYFCGGSGECVPTVTPESPTEMPTQVPTSSPTAEPTETPTEIPTQVPTEEPTVQPTQVPTGVPITDEPQPTTVPSVEPTDIPSSGGNGGEGSEWLLRLLELIKKIFELLLSLFNR